MLRTVRRNSKEARQMWDDATRALSHTLDNGFVGRDVTVEGAREWFERVQSKHTRITHDGSKYTIHYHGNHWVELLVPPAREPSGNTAKSAN